MEVLGPERQEELAARFAAQRVHQARLQASLERIDLDALQAAAEHRYTELFRGPYLGVLDTEFFRSAFQFQLKHDAPPLSLRVARSGHLKLFMAEDTFLELMGKLEEFARDLGTSEAELESLIAEEWAPWIWIVDLPVETSDSRIELVAARDHTDRPAAVLATLLAPCLLLTKDKDFEALQVAKPGDPVLAIRVSLMVNETTIELQGITTVPVLPIAAVAAGVEWIGKKAGVNPWVVGGILATIPGLIYWHMDEDRRAATRHTLGMLGTAYVEQVGRTQEAQRAALAALNERIVPSLQGRLPSDIVLRHLARSDEPMSAQRLWEQLDPATRASVISIRELLRTHKTTWRCAGRGRWSFGIPLDELLEIWGSKPA